MAKGDFVEYYKVTNIWDNGEGGYMAKIPYDMKGRAKMEQFPTLEAARARIEQTWIQKLGHVEGTGRIDTPATSPGYSYTPTQTATETQETLQERMTRWRAVRYASEQDSAKAAEKEEQTVFPCTMKFIVKDTRQEVERVPYASVTFLDTTKETDANGNVTIEGLMEIRVNHKIVASKAGYKITEDYISFASAPASGQLGGTKVLQMAVEGETDAPTSPPMDFPETPTVPETPSNGGDSIPATTGAYAYTRLHGLIFAPFPRLARWGFRARNRFIGARVHEMLHPLI